MSNYREEESSHMMQTQSSSIRRPIPRHPVLQQQLSKNLSCDHNCTCTHTSNPPAPLSPHQSQNYSAYRRQLNDIRNLSEYNSAEDNLLAPQQAVENHYVTSSLSEHSQTTNVPSVPCECGSSVQGPGSLHSNSDRSSSQQRQSCDEQQNVVSGSEADSINGNGWKKCHHRRSNKRVPVVNESSHQRLHTPTRHSEPQDRTTAIYQNRDEQKYSTCRINADNLYNNSAGGIKVDEIIQSEEEVQGPPLPPRPPLQARSAIHFRNRSVPHSSGIRKYVIWCLICGGTSLLLGILFLVVYFLLRSYTSTVSYFETVPTFVPATLLILTGLCIMSLARRRNRYSYLIKLSGAFGLASALTCALVTVTTTVLHMSRLQSLRECEYQIKTRTCTCYTQSQSDNMVTEEPGIRFVFDSTADCDVVHGALYSCLRAVFGLSVAGVLVAVFSCMLVYQLLSHERKKMYWEQLELRCRSLYSTQPPPTVSTVGPIIGTPRNTACRCCEQCHAHRNALATASYPWDAEGRFWIPGQAGNFYSPNPGSEDLTGTARSHQSRGRTPGWSWPRMPWQRTDQRFRQTPSSPDSQYGFSNNNPNVPEAATALTTVQSNYTLINAPYVWGPPPPYSDPNSPARRPGGARYQYIGPVQCQTGTMVLPNDMQLTTSLQQTNIAECHQRSSSNDTPTPYSPSQQQVLATQRHVKRQTMSKNKDNYEQTPSDSDGPTRDKFSNTLPVRKAKKRMVSDHHGVKSIGAGTNNQVIQRVNVQDVFNNRTMVEHEYNEPILPGNEPSTSNNVVNVANNGLKQSRRTKMQGVENSGFQSSSEPVNNESCESNGKGQEPAESEVYFADVSSCCNISVQNDNFYDDTNNKKSSRNSSMDKSFTKDDVDDYLAQRFGKREASVRSRLPFPQIPEAMYDHSPVVSPRASLIPKDNSRQSMCSMDSSTGEKTDFTDLSPGTPVNPPSSNSPFVASFPYSSNEQSQEAHKRLTKNLQDVFLSPNPDDSSPLTMLNYNQTTSTFSYNPQLQTRSPKRLGSSTPSKKSSSRQNESQSSSDGWQDHSDRRL